MRRQRRGRQAGWAAHRRGLDEVVEIHGIWVRGLRALSLLVNGAPQLLGNAARGALEVRARGGSHWRGPHLFALGLATRRKSIVSSVDRAGWQRRVLWNGGLDIAAFIPFIALALGTPHAHGHHPPCQVLHALCIGELGPRLAVQLPDLRAQGVVALQLLGRLHVLVVFERWEYRVREHALARGRVARREVQRAFQDGIVVGRLLEGPVQRRPRRRHVVAVAVVVVLQVVVIVVLVVVVVVVLVLGAVVLNLLLVPVPVEMLRCVLVPQNAPQAR